MASGLTLMIAITSMWAIKDMFYDYKTKILVELKYGRSRLNILQQSKVFFELSFYRNFQISSWAAQGRPGQTIRAQPKSGQIGHAHGHETTSNTISLLVDHNQMINSKKLTLVFEGLPLSSKHELATLAATFLQRPLLILRAAANSTHLALLLESSTRIRCDTQTLRDACTYEKVRPSVSTGKLNVFERLTIDWPEKWPVTKTKLGESCSNLMNGTSTIVDFCRQQPSQLRFIGQYQNSLLVYRQMTHEFKPLPKKRGHIIIGPSNCGKTTAACNILLKDKAFYVKDLTTVTFDQYCGEPGILIDDLGMHSPLLPLLKNITNIIPARVNVKHGTLYVNFEIIVVTTQYSLLELTHNPELREALMLRFYFWTMGDSYSLLEV